MLKIAWDIGYTSIVDFEAQMARHEDEWSTFDMPRTVNPEEVNNTRDEHYFPASRPLKSS